MGPEVLRRELQTYAEHKAELLEKAEGRFVLIHQGDVLGTYDTKMDDISQGYRQLGNVPFLTKRDPRP